DHKPSEPTSHEYFVQLYSRSYTKWTRHLKCNLYYYRTNYYILVIFVLGMGFLRKPVAILAALASSNWPQHFTFNEKMTRSVRQFSPHLAAKMKPPITGYTNTLHMTFFWPVIRGRPSKRRPIHICGRPRWIFVLLFSATASCSTCCWTSLSCCASSAVLRVLLLPLL
ncbi:hypothetical protein ACJX0J_017666, partial [Zea mays]